MTHLVYSDGLASVSVFLEPQSGAPAQYVESLTSVGSSSALSTVAGGLKITAIGEVPPQTVRAIASALRLAALGASPGGSGAEFSQQPGLPVAARARLPQPAFPAPAAGQGPRAAPPAAMGLAPRTAAQPQGARERP